MTLNKWIFAAAMIALTGLSGCFLQYYNLKGSNIPKDVKTFSVDFFTNEAQLVNPTLSTAFTEKLKSKFQGQTRLNLVSQNGDYSFAGAIKEYRVSTATVSNGQTAQNQFTISVKLIFSCPAYPEKNFTRDFSFFRTFDASKDFASVESSLSDEITDNIVQQIFAATALDW